MWGICFLISSGLIVSSGLAFSSMDGVRKDLETYLDEVGGDVRKWVERFVQVFMSMQVSIVSILISICVWLLLTIVEIARRRVGISIVIVATFYTILMLVSHGVGLQTSQRVSAEYVLDAFASHEDCPKQLVPRLCAFSKEGDVLKYEATYVLSYFGVGVLAMYAAFLLFIRRVEKQGGGGERYSFKSSGLGSGGGGGGGDDGLSTQMEEYQTGGAGADGQAPWRNNSAYA